MRNQNATRKNLDYKKHENKAHSRRLKFHTEICDNAMTFQECEIAILRHAVDESEKRQGAKTVNSPDVIKIIQIVEEFLTKKKLVCYGGTAINNILPKNAQFYDKNIEIPDYDFFSPNALDDAKELADIYYNAGYDEVEAKAGMHEGTYKVYVNFIPVADVTYLHPTLYNALNAESILIEGIHYAPANYLRMGMFLELSRPEGDVSRWEKVLKRMNLLNTYYPLKSDIKCNAFELQRDATHKKPLSQQIYFITRDTFISQGVVFFGGYAASLYSRYMKTKQQQLIQKIPDFDVLAENPEKCAKILVDKLRENGFKRVKLIQHTSLGEVVPEHIEVIVDKQTIAFIYRPVACHSYNTITIDNKEVNIATIDTMLSFYLAFLYANKKYYDKNRILCLSMFLFQIEQKNRLEQRGLLKRYSTKCYGKQETLETIRTKKAQLYNELSNKRNSKEYESAFLKYNPKPNSKIVRIPEKSSNKTHKPVEKTHEIQIDDEPENRNDTPNSFELRSPEFPRIPSATRPEYFTTPNDKDPSTHNLDVSSKTQVNDTPTKRPMAYIRPDAKYLDKNKRLVETRKKHSRRIYRKSYRKKQVKEPIVNNSGREPEGVRRNSREQSSSKFDTFPLQNAPIQSNPKENVKYSRREAERIRGNSRERSSLEFTTAPFKQSWLSDYKQRNASNTPSRGTFLV
jgi:hypothetical protein